MHIHILGICGTFMGGIAVLGQQAGHQITGADQNVYPPMSTQLNEHGIGLIEGYAPEHLPAGVDQVLIGNVMRRGMPIVETLLDRGQNYNSGPQWLAEAILRGKWVLAVAGTHGKTTTASMLAWILEQAGLAPGFLIGGVPENFGRSARLGQGEHFVIEADEYDTAFFDKRSKFVHYRPRTLILNNLEYDHADIFCDLAAIKWQFHQLLRTVPRSGRLVVNAADVALADVLAMGCWSDTQYFGIDHRGGWQAEAIRPDGQQFTVSRHSQTLGQVAWTMLGQHNIANALAAIAAADHVGVPVDLACRALATFRGVKRRLQWRGEVSGIHVYDDFAHHPTAIEATLNGLRARFPHDRLVAVLELRSNTMRMGTHRSSLLSALANADLAYLCTGADLSWSISELEDGLARRGAVMATADEVLDRLLLDLACGDRVVIMSNGGFGGLHDRLLTGLQGR